MSCRVQDTFARYTEGDYHGTSYPVQATMSRNPQQADEPALKVSGNKKYMNLIRQVARSQLSPSPFWKTYVGSPSYHRRRHDSRHAASLQIFNAELCGVYRLPVEIILQIVQLLPALDMFCLRMTSRRFAAIIKRKDVQARRYTDLKGDAYPKANVRPKEDIYAKAEMEARVLRDMFTKRADAEVVTAHSPDRLLCWPCRTSHPRHYFDSTEIYQSGRVRRCQGHMCLLQVCPHLYLTRGEIRARVTPDTGNMPSIDCPVLWGNGGCAYRPSWIKAVQTYIPGSRKFLVQIMFGQSLMYKTLGERPVFYRSEVKDMMCGLAARICPHMNTHDEDFLRRFNETPASRMVGSQRVQDWQPEKVFGKDDDLMAIRVYCEVEDCDTYLEIEKLTYEGATNLHFTVLRNLGKMDEPLDRKWLVQCGV